MEFMTQRLHYFITIVNKTLTILIININFPCQQLNGPKRYNSFPVKEVKNLTLFVLNN